MLCPEVAKFPPPKVISFTRKNNNLDKVVETIERNNFYSSMIISIPEELQPPLSVEKCITVDSDYYKILGCSLVEFVEPLFIEKFVKNGKLHCLSAERNSMIHNCAAITPDGILTINILTPIFQTTGFEGTKRSHNFNEVKIDLKNLPKHEKLKQSLNKLEKFDFWVSWQPNEENICPSSIAKYFNDRNLNVSVHSLKTKKLNPYTVEIPSVKEIELDEMTEWIGMLALGGDISPTEPYISTYSHPESENALKTGRICLFIVKGFITSTLVSGVCRSLQSCVISRELEHYWVSLSAQSDSDSLWQWNPSIPRTFQAHDFSCNMFFTLDCIDMFCIGQLKYS